MGENLSAGLEAKGSFNMAISFRKWDVITS